MTVIGIKLYFQTRKNAIIYFFGKLMCYFFGHIKQHGKGKIFEVKFKNIKYPTEGMAPKFLLKEYDICPRCFCRIPVWGKEHGSQTKRYVPKGAQDF